MNHIKGLLSNIVNGVGFTKSTGNAENQVTAGLTADATTATTEAEKIRVVMKHHELELKLDNDHSSIVLATEILDSLLVDKSLTDDEYDEICDMFYESISGGGGGFSRDETLLSSAKFLGASQILKKPFSPDEILSTGESLILK